MALIHVASGYPPRLTVRSSSTRRTVVAGCEHDLAIGCALCVDATIDVRPIGLLV